MSLNFWMCVSCAEQNVKFIIVDFMQMVKYNLMTTHIITLWMLHMIGCKIYH